ncbi:MAG: hypothetical protein ACRC0I_12470 [Sediminibacterium sp.]|jgi:hypothetical protein|nr:hypothetical protein [Chitinophagaceae bacterium]MCA6446584.1 hypothetical protein [Chitinophagaceae bacterium]
MTEILAVPVLKDFIGWFLDLFKFDYQLSKDRFEKIFDPAYLDMIKIHGDYNSMFSKVLETLPLLNNEDKLAYITKFDSQLQVVEHFVKVPKDSSEFRDSLLSIKSALDKDREKNDFIRLQARTLSDKIIEKSKGFKEKYFSWQILDYFLDHNGFIDKRHAELFFDELVKQGHHAKIDTPSYLVSAKLLETNDVDEIRKFIVSKKLILNDKFTKLSSAYYDLKLATYS